MRPIRLAWLVALPMTLAGQARTTYTAYDVVGPGVYPLFTPAFTSSGQFGRIASDWAGDLFVAQGGGISKIDTKGAMSPVMGFGGGTVAAGPPVYALTVSVTYYGMTACPDGDLFLAGNTAIYRVSADGLISVYSTLAAQGVACDPKGNLFANVKGAQIVRVAADGSGTPVAGTGVAGYTGDGGAALNAEIQGFLAVDDIGDLWLADGNDNVIRMVDPGGTIRTVATQVTYLNSMAAYHGAAYYSQYGNGVSNPNQVKRVDASGNITPVAGVPYSAPENGDGGPATAASFTDILDVALDAVGNLYIVGASRLRMVDTTGVVHTVAGCRCGGNGGAGIWAQADGASGLALDTAGNVYFSDQEAQMVRRLAADGTVTVVAGTGETGYSGDSGPATAARLAWPAGLAFDPAGNLYIADEQNSSIREVTASGTILTVAGTGVAGFGGDGGPASSARLAQPDGVAVDTAGNLYIADTGNHRIRKVSGGMIQTIAGSDAAGSSGDGGPAAQALLINPRSLVFDGAGNLVFTDSAARVVRRITPSGTIQRVAGTGQDGTSGDGGPATAALLDLPWALAVDAAGDVLIGDGDAVREVDVAGNIQHVGYGEYSSIRGLAVDRAAHLWLADSVVTVLTTDGPPFPLAPVINDQGITNSATPLADLDLLGGAVSAAVAPGEFVTITGVRLGPGSVRVLFDGIAAPVLSANATTVMVAAPFAIAGKASVGITVEVDGVASNVAPLAVLPSAPEIYTHSFGTLIAATALNQDGTLNGPGNPAAVGSVVSLFADGAGVMQPAETDGAVVTGPPLPVPVLPVSVTMGTRALAVEYAGAAPGLLAGALQVNVVIPNNLVPAPVAGVMDYYPTQLRVGNGVSATAYVFVKP